MITAIGLTNFKGLAPDTRVPIDGITLLAGTNSCGKSSLMQGILAIKQTVEDQHPNVLIKLNGPLVRLGQFRDVIYNHDESLPLGFTVSMSLPNDGRNPRRRDSLDIKTVDLTVALGIEQQNLVVREYSVRLGRGVKEPWFISFIRSEGKYNVTASSLNLLLDDYYYLAEPVEEYPEGQPFQAKDVHVEFSGFFPQNVGGPSLVAAAVSWVRHVASAKTAQLFDRFFKRSTDNTTRTVRVAHVINYLVKDLLVQSMSKISYIGPLREEPRRHYVYELGAHLEIGTKGEYAAQILSLEHDKPVTYFPGVDAEDTRESMLLDAVRHWVLNEFEMANHLRVKATDNAIYQVRLGHTADEDQEVTISDVGFGVSQILPIVVEGLRAAQGSLLIFEQPEIHLHPRVQSKLADFFVCLARSGNHVLIETHSDHVVTRLRRRLVEDVSNRTHRLIHMFFIAPSDGRGVVTPLKIDPLGVISNWPKGFFDGNDSELRALVLAQVDKKRKLEEQVQ